MEIQHASVKFGTLTLKQRKSLDIARNGGILTKAEAVLYKQLSADAFQKSSQEPPMSAEDSAELAKAITGTVRWGMMSQMPSETKAQFRVHLDNVRNLLLTAPFAASDEVVQALEAEYTKAQ